MADTERAVQAALSKLGADYVWGATGPDVFDCSGLVQWAFKQAGINMSRTTYTQVLEGEPVTGSPQRGDIVFPDAGHVVIALGGTKCVHAPETGDVVKISDYWTTPYAVRRVGSNSGSVADTSVPPNFQSKDGTPNLSDVAPAMFGMDQLSEELKAVEKAVAGINGYIGNLNKILQTIATLFNILTSEEGWVRILKVGGGTALILSGSLNLMLATTKGLM